MSAKETIAPVSQYHLAPQTGATFMADEGQTIRVEIYPIGEKESI